LIAPTLLASLALHAAAIGFVMWGDAGDISASGEIAVLLGESTVAIPKPRMRPKIVSRVREDEKANAQTVVETDFGAGNAPRAEASKVTATEILDLSSLQTHPYFAKLSKILTEAKRGLIPSEGRSEEFTIQLGIGDSGQILGVHVTGIESRLKFELSERMSRLSFLPELPKDVLFGRDKIEIRYRVLFPYK